MGATQTRGSDLGSEVLGPGDAGWTPGLQEPKNESLSLKPLQGPKGHVGGVVVEFRVSFRKASSCRRPRLASWKSRIQCDSTKMHQGPAFSVRCEFHWPLPH